MNYDNEWYIVGHYTNDDKLFFVDFCKVENIFDKPLTEKYYKHDLISEELGCNVVILKSKITKQDAKEQSRKIAIDIAINEPYLCCNDLDYEKRFKKHYYLIELYNEEPSFKKISDKTGLHISNVSRNIEGLFRVKRELKLDNIMKSIEDGYSREFIASSYNFSIRKLQYLLNNNNNKITKYFIKYINVDKWK